MVSYFLVKKVTVNLFKDILLLQRLAKRDKVEITQKTHFLNVLGDLLSYET